MYFTINTHFLRFAGRLVVFCLLLMACGGGTTSGPAATAAGAGCLVEAGATAPEADSVIAVMADSVLPADQSKQAAALNTVVNSGFKTRSRLLFGGLRPDQGDVLNVRLEAVGENELFRESDRECKETGIRRAGDRIATGTPADRRDVFGGLLAMAAHLSGLTDAGSIDVVLLTSMINTTKPMDMTDPTVLGQGVEKMMATATSAGLLPNCSAWRVYAIGPASEEISTDNILREFWTRFFDNCGGKLVAFNTSLITFPVTDSRPVIHKDAATGTVTAFVPTDALFGLGSSSLSSEAVSTLGPVLAAINESRPCAILTEGHADNTPGMNNQILSEDRAAAIRDWLVDREVNPRLISIRGYGETRPAASNDNAEGRARNRRVEIKIKTSC